VLDEFKLDIVSESNQMDDRSCVTPAHCFREEYTSPHCKCAGDDTVARSCVVLMSDPFLRTTMPLDVNDAYDVLLWAFVIGVSSSEIVDAVRAFGPDARNIHREVCRQGEG